MYFILDKEYNTENFKVTLLGCLLESMMPIIRNRFERVQFELFQLALPIELVLHLAKYHVLILQMHSRTKPATSATSRSRTRI